MRQNIREVITYKKRSCIYALIPVYILLSGAFGILSLYFDVSELDEDPVWLFRIFQVFICLNLIILIPVSLRIVNWNTNTSIIIRVQQHDLCSLYVAIKCIFQGSSCLCGGILCIGLERIFSLFGFLCVALLDPVSCPCLWMGMVIWPWAALLNHETC